MNSGATLDKTLWCLLYWWWWWNADIRTMLYEIEYQHHIKNSPTASWYQWDEIKLIKRVTTQFIVWPQHDLTDCVCAWYNTNCTIWCTTTNYTINTTHHHLLSKLKPTKTKQFLIYNLEPTLLQQNWTNWTRQPTDIGKLEARIKKLKLYELHSTFTTSTRS